VGTVVVELGNLVWDRVVMVGTERIGTVEFVGEEAGRVQVDGGIVLGVVDRDSGTVVVDIVVAFLGLVG